MCPGTEGGGPVDPGGEGEVNPGGGGGASTGVVAYSADLVTIVAVVGVVHILASGKVLT